MSDKEQRIRTRAYQIWEREGRAEGRAEDHWRQAEIEIERERTQPSAHAIGSQEKPRRECRPTQKGAGGQNGGRGHVRVQNSREQADCNPLASNAPA